MIKDISRPRIEDFAMAIVPPDEGEEGGLWDVYLINLKEMPIEGVLIASKGYGEIEGESKSTTTMRHFFEQVGPLEILKVEPIQETVFELTNEYWVSFTFDGQMYDKKYVFVRGSINESNFTDIPFINRKGVMIR